MFETTTHGLECRYHHMIGPRRGTERRTEIRPVNDDQEPEMAAITARKQPRRSASEKILDAAETLFIAHGYAGTTIEMIAKEAGVALQTVYFSFRSKPNILRDLLDLRLSDETVPAATAHHTWLTAALTETNPHTQLKLQVKGSAVINSRVGSLLDMLHRASDADPVVAKLWQVNQEQRRAQQRKLVTALRRNGGLAAGVRPQRAVDIITTFLGPELFCTFVNERGWSVAEWERWTAAVLSRELLVEPAGLPAP